MPSPKSIAEIKSALLHPATTSHFLVSIPLPPGLADGNYLAANGVNLFSSGDKLKLLCCETVLPGSSLLTHDITSDFHGTSHKHAYRRGYDTRIDLTFYVDAEDYLPIRFFESWMKYIVNEQTNSTQNNVKQREYFYRMTYPEGYIANSGLKIEKFERSTRSGARGRSGSLLTYNFVDVFPTSVNSMAVSYDASSLLKCTVALSYVRYYIDPITVVETPPQTTGAADAPVTPAVQAYANSRREDLDIWALTNSGMIVSVGTDSQRALLADANSYYSDPARRDTLRDRAIKGGYTAGTGGQYSGRPIPRSLIKF